MMKAIAVLLLIPVMALGENWPCWRGPRLDGTSLEENVRELGISAVPTFIFERKFGVSGAYPPEHLAQPFAQVALEGRQFGRELEGRVEVPVIDGADFDPEPPASHGALGRSIARHAARHRHLR